MCHIFLTRAFRFFRNYWDFWIYESIGWASLKMSGTFLLSWIEIRYHCLSTFVRYWFTRMLCETRTGSFKYTFYSWQVLCLLPNHNFWGYESTVLPESVLKLELEVLVKLSVIVIVRWFQTFFKIIRPLWDTQGLTASKFGDSGFL